MEKAGLRNFEGLSIDVLQAINQIRIETRRVNIGFWLTKFIGKANPELNDQEIRVIVIHFLEEDMDVCTVSIDVVPSCFKVVEEEEIDWETISGIWSGDKDVPYSIEDEFRKVMHIARKFYAIITGNTFMGGIKKWTSPSIIQIPPYAPSIQEERMFLELVPDNVVDYHGTFKIFRCSKHKLSVKLNWKKVTVFCSS
jgi:hypothetical protein